MEDTNVIGNMLCCFLYIKQDICWMLFSIKERYLFDIGYLSVLYSDLHLYIF